MKRVAAWTGLVPQQPHAPPAAGYLLTTLVTNLDTLEVEVLERRKVVALSEPRASARSRPPTAEQVKRWTHRLGRAQALGLTLPEPPGDGLWPRMPTGIGKLAAELRIKVQSLTPDLRCALCWRQEQAASKSP